jgi:thiol:disulfide interchange protein DsbD
LSLRNGGAPAAASHEEDGWIQDDYDKALKLARESNKPLFVDFTGYNCTNCRWMELKMFPRQDVSTLMQQYVLVRLYTDRPNEINKRNQKMMIERFKTVALPYYAVISPGDSTIAEFPGMTRKPEEFIEFLRRGLDDDRLATRQVEMTSNRD